MKWIIPALLLLCFKVSGQTVLDDSTRYMNYTNAYGMKIPRMDVSTILKLPDTSRINTKPGALGKNPSGTMVYIWNGAYWQTVGPTGSGIGYTIAQLRGLTNSQMNSNYTSTDGGTWLDIGLADGTVVDDGAIYIITANNRVLKRQISNNVINVKWFGAVDDGVTDATLAIKKASLALQDGQTLDFGNGTYLISYQGAAYASPFGYIVMQFTGRKNINIIGQGATIKTVNHNISTNGGFRFMNLVGCQKVNITGLNFDMTFTGTNKSASYYPFCGAITGIDSATGTGSYNTLNNDIVISKCNFKLFHPWGAYVVTGRGFQAAGNDPNNGYKLFSVFFSGDNIATTAETQNKNILIEDCQILKGHNAYAFWVWAYNNVTFNRLKAESYVSKKSDTLGNVLGTGLAFIRYHQFYNSGVTITNCDFRSKPSSERVSGFEGSSIFAVLDNGVVGNYSHGNSIVTQNNIITAQGDSVNNLYDGGIEMYHYGSTDISRNFFDNLTTSTTNKYAGHFIYYNAQSVGSNGSGSLKISANTFGQNAFYSNNIVIANGSSVSAAQRRLKNLEITNNFSYAQAQYFLQILNTLTYYGVAKVNISNNYVDGSQNTLYNSTSTNSRVMSLSASEPTDVIRIDNLTASNKYYGILNDGVNASAKYTITSPVFQNVTVPYLSTPPTNIENDIARKIEGNSLSVNRTTKYDGSKLANSLIQESGGNISVGYSGIYNGGNRSLDVVGQGDAAIMASDSASGDFIKLYQQAGSSYIIADKKSGTATQTLTTYVGGLPRMKIFPNGHMIIGSTTDVLNSVFTVVGTEGSIPHPLMSRAAFNALPQTNGNTAFDQYNGKIIYSTGTGVAKVILDSTLIRLVSDTNINAASTATLGQLQHRIDSASANAKLNNASNATDTGDTLATFGTNSMSLKRLEILGKSVTKTISATKLSYNIYIDATVVDTASMSGLATLKQLQHRMDSSYAASKFTIVNAVDAGDSLATFGTNSMSLKRISVTGTGITSTVTGTKVTYTLAGITTGQAYFSGNGSSTIFEISLPQTPSWVSAEEGSDCGSNIRSRSAVTSATITGVPTLSAPTTSTTGGTLAAGTYYYKVTALGTYGETLASNEVSQVTTGTTSTISLSWSQVTGATGYRLYRGTSAGTETVYFMPANNAITFTDNGGATTAGSPPATNTAISANGIRIYFPTPPPTGTNNISIMYSYK